MQTDYLAIIFIGGGSSHGRAPTKEEAINSAIRFLRDWDVYFKVSDIDVTVNVMDVSGYEEWSWDHMGFHGKREGGEWETPTDRPIEQITRRTPKWRQRKA